MNAPRHGLVVAFALAFALGLALPLAAQEATPPEPAGSWLERLKVGVLADVVYAHNSNDPASRRNFIAGNATSASRADEISLDLAAVELLLAPEPVGFRLLIGAGDTVEVLHSGEPDGGRDRLGPVVYASMSWAPPAVSGLALEAGLFSSHIGFESALPRDNWNLAPSYLATYTPYYQAGVKGTYAFGENWSGELHVVNGWQTARDANEALSFGGKLAWARDGWSVALNGWAGPEQADNDSDLRTLVDLVVAAPISERWRLGFESYLGAEERAGGDAEWLAAAGYVRFDPCERFFVAARAEWFDDPDAGITGFSQTLEAATLTFAWRPAEALTLRLEGRADRSDQPVFDGETGDATEERQQLALLSAHLAF